MEKAINVANYISKEYENVTGKKIDELKLQKLLYFAQRESIALLGDCLFSDEMEGWIHGPVIKEVRGCFEDGDLNCLVESVSDSSKYLLKNVILEYGHYDSWYLRDLSHKEKSWKNSRQGLAPREPGDTPLKIEDIMEDAKKVRPYDHVWDMYYDEFEDIEYELSAEM